MGTDGGIRVENENGFMDVDVGEMTTVINGAAPTLAVIAPANEINQLENQSGASANEAESGINQDSADNAKDKKQTNQGINQNPSSKLADTQIADLSISTPSENGYKYELEDNQNIKQNIYYKSSLT